MAVNTGKANEARLKKMKPALIRSFKKLIEQVPQQQELAVKLAERYMDNEMHHQYKEALVKELYCRIEELGHDLTRSNDRVAVLRQHNKNLEGAAEEYNKRITTLMKELGDEQVQRIVAENRASNLESRLEGVKRDHAKDMAEMQSKLDASMATVRGLAHMVRGMSVFMPVGSMESPVDGAGWYNSAKAGVDHE